MSYKEILTLSDKQRAALSRLVDEADFEEFLEVCEDLIQAMAFNAISGTQETKDQQEEDVADAQGAYRFLRRVKDIMSRVTTTDDAE